MSWQCTHNIIVSEGEMKRNCIKACGMECVGPYCPACH